MKEKIKYVRERPVNLKMNKNEQEFIKLFDIAKEIVLMEDKQLLKELAKY